MACVNFTLRAIYNTATFDRVSLTTALSILPITLGLSVDAGLLNNTTPGPTYSECVTVMCRRRLFETRLGNPRVRLVTSICLRQRTVRVLVLPPGTPCI